MEVVEDQGAWGGWIVGEEDESVELLEVDVPVASADSELAQV